MFKVFLFASLFVLAVIGTIPAAAKYLPDIYHDVARIERDTQAKGFDRIRTIEALNVAAHRMKPPAETQHALVVGMRKAVSARFIHGYSKFSWQDNPYVRILDLVQPGSNHASPMRVRDILAFDMAACSQQGLVLQELLKRNGIEYATVAWEGPDGHYAVTAKVDGVWRYYDSNLEPSEDGVPLRAILRDPATVLRIHNESNNPPFGKVLASYTDGTRGRVFVKDVNRNSAPKGQLMHTLTLALMGGWKV